MSVLMLLLSGPMQSWGDSSRFNVRGAGREPSKSGVLGLVASALGRSRESSLEDLRSLEFAVRVDQPGRIICDLQTEHPGEMPLSHRYYLADAKFLAALGGDSALLGQIEHALISPKWPLYLGRRSCPPDAPVLYRACNGPYDDVRDALAREPWIAAEWYRRARGRRLHDDDYPDLEVVFDARDSEVGEVRTDVPLSFGTVRRYGQRSVVRRWIDNPSRPTGFNASHSSLLTSFVVGEHDPMKFI